MFLVLLLQAAVPLALLAWLAASRSRSRAAWALKALAVGGYLAAVGIAGLWLVLPWYTPWVYAALWVAAAAWAHRRVWHRPAWPGTRGGRIGVAALGALALAATGAAAYAYTGTAAPRGPAVDLQFPLRGGTYYVANGGTLALLNAHLAVPPERRALYRGQEHGLDLVRLGPAGLRARGIAPRDVRAYAIWGQAVHAPCAGTVVHAEDGHPDMVPPVMDLRHLSGNHVVLECGDTWVVLAHLARGTVRAREGDTVRAGDVLGRVGNSGRSAEPHLHVHAQRPGPDGAPYDADPLPVRFGGRVPHRNDLVRAP